MPISAPAGTDTSSKRTSAVQAPCWPIFSSFGPTMTPGVPAGTDSAEIFSWAGPSACRAKTMNTSATGAFVMYRLLPVITYLSPRAATDVARPAGSERPAPR